MKDKRKRFALILSLTMAASMALTACADSDDSDDDSSSKKSKDSSSSVSVSSAADDSSLADTDSSSTDAMGGEESSGGDTSSDGDTAATTTTTTTAATDNSSKTTTKSDDTKTTTTAPKSDPDDSTVSYDPEIDDPDYKVTTKADPVLKAEDEITDKNVTAEQKPIYDFFMGLQDGDMKKVENSMPAKLVEALMDMGTWTEMKETIHSSLESRYGSDFKIRLYSSGKRKLTDAEIKEVTGKSKDYYNVDMKIDKAYFISINATIKGSEGSDTDEDDMAVGLVDGKWVIIDMFL